MYDGSTIKGGYIYVFGSRLHPNYYKIGCSKNVIRRLKDINSILPENIIYCEMIFELGHSMRTLQVEFRLHCMFAKNRINKQGINSNQFVRKEYERPTEWFIMSEAELMDLKNRAIAIGLRPLNIEEYLENIRA